MCMDFLHWYQNWIVLFMFYLQLFDNKYRDLDSSPCIIYCYFSPPQTRAVSLRVFDSCGTLLALAAILMPPSHYVNPMLPANMEEFHTGRLLPLWENLCNRQSLPICKIYLHGMLTSHILWGTCLLRFLIEMVTRNAWKKQKKIIKI